MIGTSMSWESQKKSFKQAKKVNQYFSIDLNISRSKEHK